MNSLINYFTGSTNQQTQQQKETKIANCSKSQVKFEEIDYIDSQEDGKNCQKCQKKQQKTDSNEEKSISSGDFQQLNQNGDSNKKNPKEEVLDDQESRVEINMEETLELRDQINQSISESHLLKRNYKSQLSKTSEMSFSDINQFQEKEKQTKQQIHNEKEQSKSSNLQYPNISQSFNSNDLGQSMEESFEDFSTRHSISKSKNNTVDTETVNNFLNLWNSGNLNKQSPEKQKKLSQTSNKQTFSFLKNQQKVTKQQKENLSNEKKDSDSQQDEIFEVNKSLISEKIKPIGLKSNEKKTSPSKQAQSRNQQQKDDQQTINMQQSFYMAKVPQKPIRVPSTKKQNEKKPQTLKKYPFSIYLKDSLFFIKYGQTPDRRLTDKIIQSLTQNFLMKNIMLPFFNIKLLQEQEKEIQIGVKKQKQELFSLYANIYFEFIHKKYQNLTRQFFEKEVEKNNGKIKGFDSQIGLKKDESPAILGVFYKKVVDYFKLSHYSKAQILKDTLQSQLSFITEFEQKWTESQSSDPSQKQKQNEQKKQQSNTNDFDKKKMYLLKQIAGLQMLISFEKSAMYCQDKLKQKLEENIWKQRKKKLIQDRNWFISNLFSVCQV